MAASNKSFPQFVVLQAGDVEVTVSGSGALVQAQAFHAEFGCAVLIRDTLTDEVLHTVA